MEEDDDMVLNANHVGVPMNTAVITSESVQKIDFQAIPVPFAPDIAIEVLSPSEKTIDTHRKVQDYIGAGSKEVWIADDFNRKIFIYSSTSVRVLAEGDTLDSSLLPGFTVAVADLFR